MAAEISESGIGGYFVKPEMQQIIEPDMRNYHLYSEKFLIFKQLYANLKDTMHQIHLSS